MHSPEGHTTSPNSTPSYSTTLEAYSRDINLANVRDRTYGIFVPYIAEAFDALPDDEQNKVGKVASQFSMREENVLNALDYRNAYPNEVAARILLNRVFSESESVTEEEKERAEKILFDAKGKKDPHILFDTADPLL